MDISVHPVQSHASLCHCLLHVHTKTVDGLICVCVLACLLFCFRLVFVFSLFFILIVSLCQCDGGWELVLQTKKTAQLPLKVNGTVRDKVRTKCIKCCCKGRTPSHDWVFGVHCLYNCISHIDGWMLFSFFLFFFLYSQSFAVIILSCWLNLQLFLKCWCWFENTRFQVVLDTTAHYFYNDQKNVMHSVLKKKSTAVCTPSFTGKHKNGSTSSQ